MTETPELTPEQRKVIDQPADARMLVTAGAGAGKTHTLVRRLDRLVEEEDLSAGEILVLTFSRAAVRELSDRLARHGEAARFVRARTFDSWALEVLLQIDAQGGWVERSFEARIEGARQAIEDGRADELFEELLHVVIDEVQDLVGIRRDLVETLLERFHCGFTVVGDPAQSIYGFTLGRKSSVGERRAETNRFFVWLRNTFGEDLTELSLTANFRAATDEARTALGFGPRLREIAESGSQDSSLYEDLRTTLRTTLNLGTLDDGFVAGALGGWDGTTAILCRTNGQALQVSGRLHDAGVEHRLQRSARDRVAPAWLGLLLRAVDGTMLLRTRFDELIATLPMPENLRPDLAWRLLVRTGTGKGNDRSIDLSRVRTALSTGRLPDELTAQPPSRVVVSSFHRAKGLEFDHVVVVDPGPLRVEDKTRSKGAKPFEVDALEEARALYVAMTRPRRDLYWLDALGSAPIRTDEEIGRWGRYGWRHWVRGGVEIIGGDVFTDRPAGTKCFEADPIALQDYLTSAVRPGDAVVLERVMPEPIGSEQSPDYLIVHEDSPIGVVSEMFRTQLYRYMKLPGRYVPRNWPRVITGVWVDSVETVVGSEAAGIEAGLGPRGVWLAPRLTGLSVFSYDQKESDVTPQ